MVALIFLLCPAPDIEPVDPRCETSTGQTKEASPQWGVPQASALSLLARNERRARSKGERRRLSERNTGSSPVETTRNKDRLRGDPFFVLIVVVWKQGSI